MNRILKIPENHPQRIKLHNEAHARQSMDLRLPVQASHMALILDGKQKTLERKHLASLCESFSIPPPKNDTDHFSADYGNFQLRWQQHAEFSTYTFYQPGTDLAPFARTALCSVPENWLRGMTGQLIAAIHASTIKLEGEPDLKKLADYFSNNTLVGSRIAGDAALAFTDFMICEDGFSRFLILDRNLHRRQAGRYIHRLFEIEVYRVLSLLALPMAKELIPKLNRADRILLRITTDMHESEIDDSQLMDELAALATEIENCFSKTHFRLDATNAYYSLVERRIKELKEVRIQGIQTIGEFLHRRLEPAILTCQTADKRLSMISERIANAGQLLRTRIDITLERQNQKLLTSMNRRAQLQLHMQTTVEGLSVAAISYYTVNLIGYLAKAGKEFGLPLSPNIIIGLSIPVVIIIIALGLRHIRKILD